MNEAWGPHGGGSGRTAREEERERLVDAFTKVAAECGYEATEVKRVALLAGLAPDAFDAHFSDKSQCMLAAYDRFFDRLVGEIEAALDLGDPWPRQVSAGVRAALGFVLESAPAARLFAVEALSLGPPAVERYVAAIQRIVVLLRLGRGRSSQAAELPPLTEAVLVAGAVSLVTSVLLAEEQEALAELDTQLVEVMLLPYVGAEEARDLAA